jgi:hypothetical protein
MDPKKDDCGMGWKKKILVVYEDCANDAKPRVGAISWHRIH